MGRSAYVWRGIQLALKSSTSLPQRLWNVPRLLAKTMRLRAVKRQYQARLNMRMRDWLLYHQHEIHGDKCTWMGVRTLKNPLDAWVYQEIIYQVRPDIIVEIGSAEGGSTLYLAHLLDLVAHGRVISIDINRAAFKVTHGRVITLTGHSTAPQVVDEAYRLCQGKSVLVIQDGDHGCRQVLADLRTYAPLVSVNSYFIVEDGIIDLFGPFDGMGRLDDGPLVAVEQFLRENNDFVVDEVCERYLVTYNPRGFLKRVR